MEGEFIIPLGEQNNRQVQMEIKMKANQGRRRKVKTWTT